MLKDLICVELAPGRPLLASALVAAIAGLPLIQALYLWLERRMANPSSGSGKGVPPSLMGVIERLIFAPAFVLAPSDAATGAFAWLTLKMAANWQREAPRNKPVDPNKYARRAFLALLSGFLSLSVAGVVGLVVRGYLGCPLVTAQ